VLLDAEVSGRPVGSRGPAGRQGVAAGAGHQQERSDCRRLTTRNLPFLAVEEIGETLLEGRHPR
jgi:hypothetical protein